MAIPRSDGKLYTAAILDCFNGEAVGLAMDDNMKKELCIRAFENACRIQGARNMIFHSDRGNQYTSTAYRACLAKYGASQSMSSTGRCYDYVRMESFWALESKGELLITIRAPSGRENPAPSPRTASGASGSVLQTERSQFHLTIFSVTAEAGWQPCPEQS